MSDTRAISNAVESLQIRMHDQMATLMLKQAAQAEKALADVLAKSVLIARNSQSDEQLISIYV